VNAPFPQNVKTGGGRVACRRMNMHPPDKPEKLPGQYGSHVLVSRLGAG
jgi:hypothetical protein